MDWRHDHDPHSIIITISTTTTLSGVDIMPFVALGIDEWRSLKLRHVFSFLSFFFPFRLAFYCVAVMEVVVMARGPVVKVVMMYGGSDGGSDGSDGDSFCRPEMTHDP